MIVEKTVSIIVESTTGKISFARAGADLEITMLDGDGAVRDQATLTEPELRSLIKEIFPGTRKPKASAGEPVHGARKRNGNLQTNA